MSWRARRYAAIQERLIAPDGTFPAIGRSIAYRCGAFHLLALMALGREATRSVDRPAGPLRFDGGDAPADGSAGNVRSDGWLRIGFCGHQPNWARATSRPAVCIFALAVLLPLGLGPADPFWRGPRKTGTSRRIWSGEDRPADHAV